MTPSVFLRAEWRWLVMLNFEVDPTTLASYLPEGTQLDDWKGRHLVSMVGFRFLHTRVRGVPIPFHRDFDEVNLRFYVRREVQGELQRGVVFIKEIVPRKAIAWLARTLYGENYAAMPMRHQVETPGEIRYEWNDGSRWNSIAASVDGDPAPLVPGSEEEFVTEHYWGYTRQRDGETVEYQVEHPPWRVWRARSPRLECDAKGLYGEDFAACLKAEPVSAFVAEGSAVAVRSGLRL